MMLQLNEGLIKRATRAPGELPPAESSSARNDKNTRSTRKHYSSANSNGSSGNSGRGRDLHEEQKANLLRAFELFDGDGDGRLSVHELKEACRALGIKGINEEKALLGPSCCCCSFAAAGAACTPRWMILRLGRYAPSLKTVAAGALLLQLHAVLLLGEAEDGRRTEAREADVYNSFSFEQFARLCLPPRWSEKSAATEELQQVFTLLDIHAKGYLTAADLLHAARAVNSSLGPADMELMIREAASEEGKGVTFEDFHRVFKRVHNHYGVRLSSTITAATASVTPAAVPSAVSPRRLGPSGAVGVSSSVAASPAGGAASASSAHPRTATVVAPTLRTSPATPPSSPAHAAASSPKFSATAAAAATQAHQLHSRSTAGARKARFNVRRATAKILGGEEQETKQT